MSTPDFFRSRLDQMIDLRHPLAVLSTRLPWALIEAAVAPKLAHQAKPAKRVIGQDLAGHSTANSAAASARPGARGCPSAGCSACCT
jgi:IS5 family transposase